MEELEVSDSKSKDVIDAVMCLKRLFTFDFSNNQLSSQMTKSIARMIAKYQEMEILCFNVC
jgi:Ran GTPase-activating protein (RanGAP) involved in mRNA processing and transport